jgi:hypothetical protein
MNKSIYKQLVTSHWDWYFLLNLEQYKLKQMIKSFSKAKHYVGWEHDVRDMKLCVALIDIICENDSMSKNWDRPICNINIRNAKRFRMNNLNNNHYLFLLELRRMKALYLYNKIRNRMLRWWW